MEPTTRHVPVAIVGGGQAGLSVSYHLKQSGIDHLVFEKQSAAHSWSTQRWDTFCLVTPNWQWRPAGPPLRRPRPRRFHEEGRDPRLSRGLRRQGGSAHPRGRHGQARHAAWRRRFRGTDLGGRLYRRRDRRRLGRLSHADHPAHGREAPGLRPADPFEPVPQPGAAARGRGPGGRLGSVGRADRRGPASRGPQGASRGGRRAPLRPLLPRPGRRHLAGRHGLLRDVGRQPSFARRRARQHEPLCHRPRRGPRHRPPPFCPGGHAALWRARGVRGGRPAVPRQSEVPRSTRPTGPTTASMPPSTSSSPRRGSRLRRRRPTPPCGSRRRPSPASISRAPASAPSSGASASRRTSPGSTLPCSTAAASPNTRAASPSSPGSTSWACRGCTPGARAVSARSAAMPNTVVQAIRTRLGADSFALKLAV